MDRVARHATEANHTATHLLQAALRERLGAHVRQAGSYVGPDKLRFDFSHGQALSAEELRDVEDRVNEWIARNDPVRPITTTLEEARRLGAMALFGEKYGDVVRMVEIGEGDYSRELCGGTHVRSTAEIGLLRILSETSSSANVRRIEAVTGPAAVGSCCASTTACSRRSPRAAHAPARTLPDAVRALAAGAQAAREGAQGGRRRRGPGGVDVEALAARRAGDGGRDGARREGGGRRRQGAARRSSTASRASSATPRSCSAPSPTGACTSSRASLPRSSSAA